MIELEEKELHEKLDEANQVGYDHGFAEGDEVGYERGCEAGYEQAKQEAREMITVGASALRRWLARA